MPPGPRWVQVLRDGWSAGAAVMPIDHRLPAARVRDLIARGKPTVIALDGPRERLERLRDGVPVDDDVRLVVATSGTAGTPKLAELTEAALTAAVGSSGARIGAGPGDPWLACLPVAHIGGMLVLVRAVALGTPVEVHAAFDVASVSAAPRSGARFTSLVPTMLLRLIAAGADLSGFARILIGGSALDPDLRARALAAGANVVSTYGMTETCGGVVYDGRPLDGVEIAVRAGDDHIVVRGSTLMRGYRLDPAATAAAFDPGGWLRTGDAGSLRDGTLTMVGRLDDAIVTGGEKVWPAEVEAAIRAHTGVEDVLVVGEPDAEWGERVVALVVPDDPAGPPAPSALRAHLRGLLPRQAIPREIRSVRSLPRTASGKLRREPRGTLGDGGSPPAGSEGSRPPRRPR
jgi:O-succinylbenzoic acid--CoA ligase